MSISFTALVHKRPESISCDRLQIFDLLQLSRKEKEVQRECLWRIQRFNEWKKAKNPKHDFSDKICARIEGILLRRQARESVLAYRSLRKLRVKLFHNYMNQLPAQKNLFIAVA